MPDEDDFRRLEGKVDRLTDAITTLVRVEERQATHGTRIGNLEEREAAQARPLREMIIALVDGKAAPEAKAELVAIEADVAALRAEMVDEAKKP